MDERISKDFGFKKSTSNDNGTLSIGRVTGIPNINSPQPPGNISTWFLGTRAENAALFKELIDKAVAHIIEYRHSYLPGDPETITPEVKASKEYQAGVSALIDAYDKLLNYLREYGTPFFSMRYQGHEFWDVTLPGLVGYFAAMLHNPNNSTIQASTLFVELGFWVNSDL